MDKFQRTDRSNDIAWTCKVVNMNSQHKVAFELLMALYLSFFLEAKASGGKGHSAPGLPTIPVQIFVVGMDRYEE
jgi:hypothetical protein